MGSKLLFYLIIKPISLLPFWVLYRISDLLYLFLFQLFAYRKSVVKTNIQNSFPNHSEAEINKIVSKFYRHLCDLIVESIKAFSINLENAKERMKDRNIEELNQHHKSGKQVVLVGGHYGNWELFAITIGQASYYNVIALYTPLKNKFINKKITESRSKYGLQMLAINQIKEQIKMFEGQLFAIIFGADQSPRKSQRAYWMRFLNQETGVQFGTEKFAKEYDAAVVFANIYKIKRGYYEVEYTTLTNNASKTEYGEITQRHTKMLEEVIVKQPEYWLWSHKRWKHKRPKDAKLN